MHAALHRFERSDRSNRFARRAVAFWKIVAGRANLRWQMHQNRLRARMSGAVMT
jgi:hypothetical protein